MQTKSIVLSSLFTLVLISLLAFRSAEDTPKKTLYMQVSTIESIIPAGGGRSRMIITLPDGNQNNSELENLYSIGGINFGNVQSNERAIIEKINHLTSEGWQLQLVTSGVQSPSASKSQGIFITRYLFRKQP
jgi:hypothetical protein